MSVAGTTAPVALDVVDGVARLRLNRPEASNGMNVEFLKALHEAVLACHAYGVIKSLLATTSALSPFDILDREAEHQARLFGSDDFAEGIDAFRAKRRPKFGAVRQ
jgi:2-(1,2-epoxy-1,2-dihydrophenyl)acetyl-CoA isomerase